MSSEKIYNLPPAEYGRWRQFLSAHTRHNLFYDLPWATMLHEVFKRPYEIRVLEQHGEIEAGIIYWPRHAGTLKAITLMPATAYQGVLFSSGQTQKPSSAKAREHERIGTLLESLQKEFDVIDLYLPPEQTDIRPYTWRGFEARTRYTYRFGLQNEEDFLEQLSQDMRRKIRKAEKQGLQLLPFDENDTFVEMIFNSYGRHGKTPPLGRAELKAMLNSCSKETTGRGYYLQKEDSKLAGLYLLEDAHTVYALFSGMNETKDGARQAEALHVKALQQPRYRGKTFDFLGANTPELEQFKRGFGGLLVPHYQVTWCVNAKARALLKMRRATHRLKRKKVA